MRVFLKCAVVMVLVVVTLATRADCRTLKESDLYERATLVLEVTVVMVEESPATGTYYYTLQVDDVVKGESESRVELVRVPKKPEAENRVAGGRKLREGEEGTLYLETETSNDRRLSYVLGLMPNRGRDR